MRSVCHGALFGGAIFSAGIAAADVTVSQVTLSATLDLNALDPNPYSYGYVDAGNQSFFVQGGLEVLPFSRSGRGGPLGYDVPYITMDAAVTADASLTPAGGLTAYLSGEAHVDNWFGYGDGNNTAHVLLEIAFSLTETETYTIAGQGSYAYLGGRWSIVIRDGDGATVFERYAPSFPVADDLFDLSGVLGAGDYTLTVRAHGTDDEGGCGADVAFDFLVTPTPGTAAVMGGAGLLACRRRR